MKILPTISVTLYLLIFSVQPAFSQDRLPVREYTRPDERIALSQNLSFEDALDILEEYSIEFKDKIFVVRSDFSGPVGIEIPQMHWEDALRRILAHNGLYLTEHERYVEIRDVPLPEMPEERIETVSEQNHIHFGSREIEISATFFQGDKRMIRELGIDWTTLQDGRVRVSHFGASSVGQDVFEIEGSWSDILDTGWDINALFSAFETNEKGEILASPTIKVLDGETGSIQVGQDFSIKQRDFAGNITDQFFSTGTILRVTPRVYYHDGQPFIYMTVNAERSTAQPDPISTIVNKQEATTELLLLSGESAVIAGLYETEVVSTRRGVPLLKDLPGWFLGLRYLFGYESKEQLVHELVVLVEATLVPSLEERLNAPLPDRPGLLRDRREDSEQEIRSLREAVETSGSGLD